jgi:hypothetical protein
MNVVMKLIAMITAAVFGIPGGSVGLGVIDGGQVAYRIECELPCEPHYVSTWHTTQASGQTCMVESFFTLGATGMTIIDAAPGDGAWPFISLYDPAGNSYVSSIR